MTDEDPINGELMLLTVGERLVEARKAKNLTLQDIAKSTRISHRHLESLENNDFKQLPARTYTIGFARAYAKVVELPESEWLPALREELDSDYNKRQIFELPDSNIEESGKLPSAKTAWIIAAAGFTVVALAYIIWRSMSGFAASPDLATVVNGDDAAQEAGTETAEGEAQNSLANGNGDNALIGPDAPVVFTATQDRIWVKFYDANGDQLMQKEMALGETYTVPADADGPQLATARPDALSITVNGKLIPALGTAERVIRDVPVDPVSLANRTETEE